MKELKVRFRQNRKTKITDFENKMTKNLFEKVDIRKNLISKNFNLSFFEYICSSKNFKLNLFKFSIIHLSIEKLKFRISKTHLNSKKPNFEVFKTLVKFSLS